MNRNRTTVVSAIRTLDSLTLGSFNVRGLSSNLKRENLFKDLASYKVDICSLQETKLANGLETNSSGYRLICPAPESRHYGLGFAVSKGFAPHIQRYWTLSDRVGVLTVSLSKKTDLAVVNAYGPTSAKCAQDADEADRFYSTLATALDAVRACSLVFITGDFNAKAGTQRNGETCMGSYGRGKRNMNGQALVDFCDARKLFLCNTAFQHHARHRTTWTGWRKDSASGNSVPVYNQIDYILCRQQHKGLLTDSRSYNGCTAFSDHRLVVARIRPPRLYAVSAQRMKNGKENSARINIGKLAGDVSARCRYAEAVRQSIADQPFEGNAASNSKATQQSWERVSSILETSAQNTVGTSAKPQSTHKFADEELFNMSKTQKDLRLRIQQASNPDTIQQLKHERNVIMHSIRKRTHQIAEAKLDQQAAEVENLKDSAKMFKAVQLMTRKKSVKPVVADASGRIVGSDREAASVIRDHFSRQFSDPNCAGLEPFQGHPRPLDTPLTAKEVCTALKRLNNGRAAGSDGIHGELLKCCAEEISPTISELINSVFERHDPVDIGHGLVIPLQKPGKPRGPPSNLRPIVLLTALRKAISLITLTRISPLVNQYLSSTQSGFRAGRSTSDIVWAHRWFTARCERYKTTIDILGIDMSKAIRVGDSISEPFSTTIGTPQGDSLSPVLFVIYLEAALRDLRMAAPPRPATDVLLPPEISYADDVDFVSHSRQWLHELESCAVTTLADWHLYVNQSKTEFVHVARGKDRAEEEWRAVKKLGSLIGVQEDITRRKQLAMVAFNDMQPLWKRRKQVRESLRLRLYNAFIMPILSYNAGTWGAPASVFNQLDAFHRSQLRRLLGITWPQTMNS